MRSRRFVGMMERGRHTDNERDHARAVATSGLETLNQFLHLPYLNLAGEPQVSARKFLSMTRYGPRRGIFLCSTDILLRFGGVGVTHDGLGGLAAKSRMGYERIDGREVRVISKSEREKEKTKSVSKALRSKKRSTRKCFQGQL